MVNKTDPKSYFKDEPDGGFTITTVADAEPILEANKRAYNEWGDKKTFGKMGDAVRVASIPILVWQNWVAENPTIAKQNTPEGRKLLKAKLDDPSNKFFLTAPVKI